MACHNEKVARTRRHVEHKRNRSIRRAQRDKEERERQQRDRRMDASSLTTPVASSSFDHQSGTAPVSPAATSQTPSSSLRGSHDTRSPSVSSTPSDMLKSNSLDTISRPPTHRRPSDDDANRSPGLGISRSASPSAKASPSLSSARPASPSPKLASPKSGYFPATGDQPSSASQAPPRSSSMDKTNTLSAPSANKAANRRSGFYGVNSLSSSQTGLSQSTEESPSISHNKSVPAISHGDIVVTNADENDSNTQTLKIENDNAADASRPLTTFYDPDMLVFLDAVGDAPENPKTNGKNALS